MTEVADTSKRWRRGFLRGKDAWGKWSLALPVKTVAIRKQKETHKRDHLREQEKTPLPEAFSTCREKEARTARKTSRMCLERMQILVVLVSQAEFSKFG